jgi:uncharacterized protein YndB with AHSA1/START domain
MTENNTPKRIAGTSDESLKAKTGRTWEEWFALLDSAGAMEMNHPEIAILLKEKQGVPDWWCQKITGGYEQERKGREKHQMPQGFQISASKTVNAPLGKLYAAWSDKEQRNGWLQELGLYIRKATLEKSLRITWIDGKSNIEVLFSAKGTARSQVSVQHNKLSDANEAAQLKEYWNEKLDQLDRFLRGEVESK